MSRRTGRTYSWPSHAKVRVHSKKPGPISRTASVTTMPFSTKGTIFATALPPAWKANASPLLTTSILAWAASPAVRAAARQTTTMRRLVVMPGLYQRLFEMTSL